jgi:hypothetical protein
MAEKTTRKLGITLKRVKTNGNILKALALTFAVPFFLKKNSGNFPIPIVQVLQ